MQPIIDTQNGDFSLHDGFRITKRTSPEDLLDYFGTGLMDQADHGNGWKKLSIRNVLIDDDYFCFSFWFSMDVLQSIHFVVDEKEFEFNTWDHFSETDEPKRHGFYIEWLANQIGDTAGHYPWGTIDVVQDPKVGFSMIHYRYAQYEAGDEK